ncbi:MAG: hypothetical protein Q4D55_06335 [Eubacteriales bacterium]|nr:hypothetical protein [Eubacteriales bacterium]
MEERKKKAVEAVREAVRRETEGKGENLGEALELLWEALRLFQGVTFETARRLEYTYAIRGNEMFVSRKGKSITRSTVDLAFQRAVELQRERLPISGPKKLGCFGASYLYPVFLVIGVVL